MSEREMKKNGRNANEKGKDGEAKKPGKMLDVLKKMGLTPLKTTIIAVATTAVLATGCGSSLSTDRDADEDVESDAPEFIAKIPRPPLEIPIPMPRDAETDGDVVGDVGEDSAEDVVEDADEEVTIACDARNASRTELLYAGGTANVGGIDVRYDGPTSSGDGEYSILCEDVVVRSGIVVAIGSTHVENVSEQSFSVELTPSTVTTFNSRVDIAVRAE